MVTSLALGANALCSGDPCLGHFTLVLNKYSRPPLRCEGLSAALEAGLIVQVEPGQAAFRHALIREAVYGVIAWSRRRRLHRQMAEQLEARGGAAQTMALAEHWLAARDLRQACATLLTLAERWCSVHAYRDAAGAIQRALEKWPPEENEPARLDVLDRLGLCAQMSGDLVAAARAWREAAAGRRQAGDQPRFADSQRRLAGLYELQGQWDQRLAARQAAAEAFAQCHLPGEAAAERLAIAAHLDGACHFSAAVEAATLAAADAAQAGRVDLQASALAVKGESLAKLGQYELGRQTVDAALALALEHNLIGPASDAYSSLAAVLQQSGNLAGARDSYHAGIEFCQTEGILPMAQICLACLAVVLRENGRLGSSDGRLQRRAGRARGGAHGAANRYGNARFHLGMARPCPAGPSPTGSSSA